MAKDQELTGTVRRLFFEKNDFVIAALQDGPDVKGTAPAGDIKPGLTYRFLGQTVTSETYGEQFHFTSYALDVPHERDGVIAYLSKMAKGVGVVSAGKLWDAFGPQAVDVLTRESERAVKAGCVTARVAAGASASLRENVEAQKTRIDLLSLFNGLGFHGSLVPAIIKDWGVAAPQIVRDDPFRLMLEEKPGCGFSRVDHLHHRLGHPHTSPRRQMALAWSKVRDNHDGHTWIDAREVHRRVADEIGGDCDPDYAVQQAVDAKLLVRHGGGGEWLALPSRSAAEGAVARGVARLLSRPARLWPDADELAEIDDHQRAVARTVLADPVGVLTGVPGTGKTFVSAQIIKSVRRLVPPDEIAVVAPTGKAAVRITRALHEYGVMLEATTIHRLLQIVGHTADGFKFYYGPENRLPYKVVVVDEVSMLDTDLAAALLDSLEAGTHLLLIGDPYQLPPVGHGAPLRDLIESGVACGELTEIRRNSGLIVAACRDIKNGFRYTTCDKFDDAGNNFRSVEAADNPATLATIRALCRKLVEKAAAEPGLDPIEDVQVLTVVNAQSELGRYNLNRVLQAELNPHGQGGDAHPFRVNDKVICLVNGRMKIADRAPGAAADLFDGYFPTSADRKEVYVANGDMGRVLAVSPKTLVVRFTSPTRLVFVNLPGAGKARPADGSDEGGGWGPVDLGYAVTTHKCVHPDTLVETEDGLLPIRLIAPGGTLATPAGVKAYTNKVHNPEGPALAIATDHGYALTVTPEHGVERWDGGDYARCRADEVKPGDWVRLRLGAVASPAAPAAFPRPTPGDVREVVHRVPAVLDRNAALFLGLMVADGTLFHGGFRLLKRHPDVADTFGRLARDLFGCDTRPVEAAGASGYEVHSTYLSRWLTAVGGMSPHAKAVPEVVLRSPPDLHAAFLRGLFEDGGVSVRDGRCDHIGWTTAVPALAAVVRVMLLRLGIITATAIRPDGMTALYIYGRSAAVFRDRVGFVTAEKTARLADCRETETRHVLPVGREQADSLRGLVPDTTVQNARARGCVSRDTARAAGWLDRLDWYEDRVASVTPTACESLCVEVPDGHRFLQNGFPFWNSQGSEWPYVIVPIDESDRAKRVVSRELLYTAISRAKKRCLLVGRRAVADEWCQTVVMRKRKTFLKDRVRTALAKSRAADPAAESPGPAETATLEAA